LKRILSERSVLGAFGATMLAIGLGAAWARTLHPAWLVAAVVACLAGAVLLWRARQHSRRPLPFGAPVAVALTFVALAASAGFVWQFQRMERDWAAVVEAREQRLGAALSARMSQVVRSGRAAADSAARSATAPQAALFQQLALVRERSGVDAVAVYTADGDLVAWAGEHRGPLPDSIWLQERAAFFDERPLFSYLYFASAVPGGDLRAVAAVLVETGIIGGSRDGAIADIVAARTRTRATFRRGPGSDAVWWLEDGGHTIVHARLEPITQAEWRRSLERTARRVVLLTLLAAYVALALAWLRWSGPAASRLASNLPLFLLVLLAALMPVRGAIGGDRLFSPLLFTLPLPGDVSLGRFITVLLPLAALAAGATWVRVRRPRMLPLLVAGGALIVVVAYPAAIRLLLSGATPALLQDPAALWLGLLLAGVLLLGTLTHALLPRLASKAAAPSWLAPTPRRLLLALAILTPVLLVLGVARQTSPVGGVGLMTAALWALPFSLAALALAPVQQQAGSLLRWMMAAWLAGTAVLPHLWDAHLDARLSAAESELETLGVRADPYLDYLLVSFGREALTRFAAGEGGVQLLYRTWVASGMAQEPYPARIVLWSPERVPTVQLGAAPLMLEAEVDRLTAMVDEARYEGVPILTQFTDLPNVSKLLTVPFADGSLLTVVVPPRRSLDRTSAVAPFLGVVAQSPVRLNLIEASVPEPEGESISWVEAPDGWRSEAVIKYPDGWYHAHLVVPVSGLGIRSVRATLLLAFCLGLIGLLWVAGMIARGRSAVPRTQLRSWLGSFRARITVALFAFFLVPTAAFGWAAYSALAGEVARAAERVAQHSVTQAVIEFEDAAGDLRRLALHAGTDVLRYHGGELIDVSSREALDLGVYSAWMPPHVYQRLESGEEREALETQTLGTHSFVTAYRAMRPTGTLGVPMSLSAGDAAFRLRELAHLVLFAAIVGALLSLALSLAVGRALARPIGQLSRAATAVGGGTLRVQLPERSGDEFGQLFASFNRMTRRLRRARARELRTARVLAWGEMARQVAHEIKNPLTPIKLSVQHLRRAYADRHPTFEDILDRNVSQILVEIDRLSEIARAFSRYGAPGFATGPLEAVRVPDVIREALTLYRSGDRNVEYVDRVDAALPLVRARADELKEVLLNLVENSRAALDGGKGSIVVSAAERESQVEILVADDGPGVPRDLLPRVFDPHFSTRSTGTGLGLAIVRRLVESWGGSVTAESEEGRGTVVRIRLLAADTAGAPEPRELA
jgi:signal transduction histidine kinase